MATSTWSEAIFVTWIEVPPSGTLIRSTSLKVQLLDNRCCPLRLLVSLLFRFETSRALNYNDSDQHQPSRYLLIPPSRLSRKLSVLITIMTDLKAFQVILVIEKQETVAYRLVLEAPYQPVDGAEMEQNTVSNSITLIHVVIVCDLHSIDGDFSFIY
jgi:hypothetical protein